MSESQKQAARDFLQPGVDDLRARIERDLLIDLAARMVLIGHTDCSLERFMRLAGEAKELLGLLNG